MNQSSQSENNKWQLTPQQLDTRCGPGYEIDADVMDNSLQWFRYNGKTLSGDTEQEIREQRIAIQEQVRLGIIKIKKNENVAPALAPNAMGSMNPKMKEFERLLKQDPNKMAPHLNKDFRPKVRDNKTGKVRKLGPNDRCPCGSGKKFEKCHGRGKF